MKRYILAIGFIGCASMSAQAEVWTCSLLPDGDPEFSPEPVTYVQTSEREFLATYTIYDGSELSSYTHKYEVVHNSFDKRELRSASDDPLASSVHLHTFEKRAHEVTTWGNRAGIVHKTGLCEVEDLRTDYF